MRRIALLAALLAGCVGQPVIVDSSENAVVVSRHNMTGSAGMIQMAEAHCAKFGKRARFVGKRNDFADHYECLP